MPHTFALRACARRALPIAAGLVLLCAAGARAASTSLLLPQSTAFAVLGHSCGGIAEQAFATGFATPSGAPQGDVYLQTRCSTGGRGGHTTTYAAWTSVTWTFAAAVASYATLSAPPGGLSPTFTATDVRGDTLANALSTINVTPASCTVSNTTYCTYRAYLTVPAPSAPARVAASDTGDALQVSWTIAARDAPVISSSTITAAPVGSSAPVLTASVGGNATSGVVGSLAPATTYRITVVSYDLGGASAPSSPVTLTTPAASIAPSAPAGVTPSWTAPGSSGDMLAVRWNAAVPGNAPVDAYEVSAAPSGGDLGQPPPISQTVPGTTLLSTLAASDLYDWGVQVRAHNVVGWGPWSPVVFIGASG